RAAALDNMPGGEIGEGCPYKPDRIDPEMAVEPAILDRDYRLWQIGRHLLQGQRLPEKIAIRRQQAAICREYSDARAPLGACESTGVGQREGEIPKDDTAEDRHPQKQQNADLYDACQKPFSGSALPRRAPARRRSDAVCRVEPQLRLSHQRAPLPFPLSTHHSPFVACKRRHSQLSGKLWQWFDRKF